MSRRLARSTRLQRAMAAAFDLDQAELDELLAVLRIRARWLERFDWWRRSA